MKVDHREILQRGVKNLMEHNDEFREKMDRLKAASKKYVNSRPIIDKTPVVPRHDVKKCKYELDVLEPYSGPPCKKRLWTVRGCTLHGKCVRNKGLSIRSCDMCTDYSPDLGPWRHISRGRAHEFCKQLQAAAKHYVEHLPEYEAYRPRGIIVSGGGKYLPSAYVTIRAIRHQDTTTPIELWYVGDDEYNPTYVDILKPYNVEWVDASKLGLHRSLRKYAIKSFAVRHCDFEKVIHLDADSYPTGDMNLLWDHDAIFWPDIFIADKWFNAEKFGVKEKFPTAWETGQYVIDRKKCWDVLNLAYFYDQHNEYTWHYGWGDTGTWRAAWSYFDRSPTIFAERPTWVGPAYLQMGPDGQTAMFVHRCRDKFRINNSKFYTGQHKEYNYFCENLPLEKECFAWLEELKKLV